LYAAIAQMESKLEDISAILGHLPQAKAEADRRLDAIDKRTNKIAEFLGVNMVMSIEYRKIELKSMSCRKLILFS
jgi:hypothetical protein